MARVSGSIGSLRFISPSSSPHCLSSHTATFLVPPPTVRFLVSCPTVRFLVPLPTARFHCPPTPVRFPVLRCVMLDDRTLSADAAPSSSDTFSGAGGTLEIIGGARESILPVLKMLDRPYKPFPVICWNRHSETIFASFYRSLPGVRLRRECLRTPDNGAVALDWAAGDEIELPAESPVLILMPGLTGGSGDTYVQHMLVQARRNRWRVVVFNSRGCANSPVTTPQLYSASFTEDLREVVKHIMNRYPRSNVYAVGWSLGANILVRYLGEESQYCPLSGAVSLCNPFNLVLADEDFHKGFNNIYDRVLARALTKIFKKHLLLFEGIGGEYNIQLAANAKTVREFDDGLTRVSFGFKSVDDYYFNSSSSDSIKHVRTPLLCIQAENDPIAPSRGIPRQDIKENPSCLLIVTPKGGHLGWVAGDNAPFGAPWTDPVVMEFLKHLEKARMENFASCINASLSVTIKVEGDPQLNQWTQWFMFTKWGQRPINNKYGQNLQRIDGTSGP